MMPLATGKFARSIRSCITASLLLNLATVLAPMTLSAKPLVPLLSFLQHWDHHWYAWLPGDPVYEAVEVMATERSGQEPHRGARLVSPGSNGVRPPWPVGQAR